MSAARVRRRPASAVELERRGAVAWITLARPATQNRLDADVLGELADACAAVEDDDRVRVAVLAARGGAFSAGLPAGCGWPGPGWPDGIGAVARLTKPVIAAVSGDALGWGLALALACDVRVATRGATFALPELAEGCLPGGGVVPRLVRMVGVARTLELVLLGVRLSAPRAAAWGLVRSVVDPRRLAAEVDREARALAGRGPLALRLAKEAVLRALDLPLADGMRLEHDLYVLLQTTVDRREGVRAFIDRRRPRFRGR